MRIANGVFINIFPTYNVTVQNSIYIKNFLTQVKSQFPDS